MNMLNNILHRRSVRRYSDEAVPQDKLEQILYAGLAAASSKNRRPWEFIVVRDRKMLHDLCDCRPGASNLLEHCDTAIVVIADSELADVWVEDCASAMTQMHLMADSLNVGSCWLQIRLRTAVDGIHTSQDVIRDRLGIPSQFSVMAVLTLGMPAEHPGARQIDELPMSKIHFERF